MKVGSKVGCFLGHDRDEVKFLGFGVIEETREVPPEGIPNFGTRWDRVELDGENLDVVWSSECAMYSEKKSMEILRSAKVVQHIGHGQLIQLRKAQARLLQLPKPKDSA